jgi:hypothetical protein
MANSQKNDLGNLARLLSSTNEILQAFDAAVTAFNALNKDDGVEKFMDLLDPNVLLENLDGTVTFRGETEVRNFINDKLKATKPQFIPSSTPVTHDVTQWFGYVKGSAQWTDHDGDSDDAGVSMGYDFGFAKAKVSGKWLLFVVRSSRPYIKATAVGL